MPVPFDAASTRTTLFAALLAAARRHGRAKSILEDVERQPLTYDRLVLASLVLGARLRAYARQGQSVGVMLPNVNGMVVTLLGLNAYGRVAALLNFTAGVKNLRSAARIGRICTLLTSRRFVETAKLDDVIAALEGFDTGTGRPLRVVYLEDVRRGIGTADKLGGIARSALSRFDRRWQRARADDPAVILFTSGTEGEPKGVVLSNANLVASARQIGAHATGALGPDDIVMNPLPMFHSFGLTAATLMPLLQGMKVVLYPSPLHYKQVPQLVRDTGATVLFSTDTFLQGYARAASPADLVSLRWVIAGAERAKETTRQTWAAIGAGILEGYGATECSPVISCNLPDALKPGSVGCLLPGIQARLDPVEGIHEGGRLAVRGPNVMLGYRLAADPDRLVPPANGWHDTGDIVDIDADGFITIKGRAKRFAKLGGEMVSLAAVESMVSELWPDVNHVVLALPDARKGEQLVLVTEKPDADRETLLQRARAAGFAELWIPRAVLVVAQIPVLGSGKIDYTATVELARQTRALL
jgi:acyl-[acyl-carrier-protein]-phospholipid O-acyltransferase / long-chain-fatty-acid--[acyl-carrier-protein] ligase